MQPSMPNTPGPEAPPTAPLGHEPHRVNIKAIVACGCAMVFFGMVVHVVMSGFMVTLEPSPRAKFNPRPLPSRPELPQDLARIRKPVLQASNDEDMVAQRKKEDALLSGPPSWVDREKGIVRIPIEQAMKLLAKEKGR